MVSIMPVFRRSDSPVFFCILILSLVYSTIAWSDFEVTDIQARLSKKTLAIKGSIDLVLSDKAEEALSKGIPLNVIIDANLVKTRPVIWDQQLASWKLQRSIRFHALSGQYLVSTTTKDQSPDIESFISLQEALSYMGNIDLEDLALAPEKLQDANNYLLELRAFLDITALPAPLRPVAYTSRPWHLNSGWTTWKVQR
jgi:Domain of unknown function (DUF4390)